MAVTEKSPGVLSVGEWHSLENYMIFDTKKQKAKITDEKTVKSKYAALAYRLVGTGERYNFLEIKLKTGRTHQIRCQLAYAGHVIRGDVKYGARRSQKEGGIRLHNFRLAFTDPYRGTTKRFCVPPTKDSLWQVAWEAIENVSGTDVENI